MRSVLLDEGVPRQLATVLRDASLTVFTIEQAALKGVDNGRLLRAAEGRYDVMVTADQNIYAQQNLTGRTISIVVMPTNRRSALLERAADVVSVVTSVEPGRYVRIGRDGSVTTLVNDRPDAPGIVAFIRPFDVGRR